MKRIAVGFPLVFVSACVTVDPRGDFERTRGVIVDTVGVDDLYDPTAEEQGQERVEALLEGGLSADEAVRVALLNNRGFQAAFLEVGASRADVVQSGLLTNPSLSLSLRFPEGGGRSNLTGGLAQQIADFWQIPVRKRVAEAELEQVILSAADAASRLSAEVKSAYYMALAAAESEALAGENLELVRRTADLAQARFDAGEVGQVDVNLVRMNLIQVQIDAMTARRNREAATNQLTRLLGLSRARVPVDLTDSWPASTPLSLDEDEWLVTALEHRLDARVAALRVQAAEADLERETRNVFPSVTLGFEAERPERRALPGRTVLADTARASVASGALTAPSIQPRSERRRERSQIIDLLLGPTLDITLPIWDQNQAQIAKAAYRVRQLRANYDDLLDHVTSEVIDVLSAIRAAQDLVRFYQTEALPRARQSLEAARATYEVGEQSVLILIDAEETLIAQQRGQMTALRDWAQTRAELERVLGVPMSAILEQSAGSQPPGDESNEDGP